MKKLKSWMLTFEWLGVMLLLLAVGFYAVINFIPPPSIALSESGGNFLEGMFGFIVVILVVRIGQVYTEYFSERFRKLDHEIRNQKS